MNHDMLPASARASRKATRWTMQHAGTGTPILVDEPHAPTRQLQTLSKSLGTLKSPAIRLLLRALAAASARSRTDRVALRFTVEIEPGGALRIVSLPPTRTESGATPAAEAAPAVVTIGNTGEGEGDNAPALAAARARGRDRVAAILARPDMLAAERFGERYGMTRATVNNKRLTHQLLGLEGATRGFRYPDWQVDDDGKPFVALPAIFAALDGSPWAVYRFLIQEHNELDGMSGREALRRGLVQPVIDAAESVARAFA